MSWTAIGLMIFLGLSCLGVTDAIYSPDKSDAWWQTGLFGFLQPALSVFS